MCGIAGFYNCKDAIQNGILYKMLGLIYHRGPDDEGTYTMVSGQTSISMGMRRLSIIDLNSGRQPIWSNDETNVIVFNGEIYNFLELRITLENKGYKFKSKSDTEVVVNLFQEFGPESFSMLDGMFAFSIFNRKTKKVYIARDFFGEKPLYYKANDESFFWSSELKSIIVALDHTPEIDIEALNLYFRLSYIPAPYTIYHGIRKLEANSYIELDVETGKYTIKEIKQKLETLNVPNKEAAVQKVHDLIFESVESRSIADVPLGTFLSGGVDSSIISFALAHLSSKKINTFSIGFKKKSFDETDKSRIVAQLIGSDHHEFVISEKDLADNIDKILLNFDEPFADSSALPTYLVSKFTKQHVTVALTGDGGDEVFGGYNKYYMGRLNSSYTAWVPPSLHGCFSRMANEFLFRSNDDDRGIRFKLRRIVNSIDYSGNFYYNIMSLGFIESELQQVLHSNYLCKSDALEYYKKKIGKVPKTLHDFRKVDKILSLEGDMLVKVDRTSMLSSLECRAPFLNKKLWNLCLQLPEDYLIKGLDKKHILKETFKHYFPKGFLNRSKRGFGVPVGDWLRQGLKHELLMYVDKERINRQGIFKYSSVESLVRNHISGKIDNTFRVWTFYCFQKWYFTIYEKSQIS